LNIRANTNPGVVGSVVFRLDSNLRYRTESSAPYALAGDSPIGDYLSWTPAQGDHLVVATPYSQANAKGGAGSSLAITFTVN